MKKSLLYLAAFAGLTACVQDLKEDVVLNPAENNGLALTINATMDEPQTRVVTEDGKAFKFAADDEIGVYFYHPALASKTIANVKFTAQATEEGKVQFVLSKEHQDAYASAVSALLTQEDTKIYSYAPYKAASGSVEGNTDGGITLTKSGDEVGAKVKVTRNFTLPTNQNTADDVKSMADHYAVVAKSVSPVGDNDGKYTADLNYSGIYTTVIFNIVNTTNRSLDVTGFRFTVGEGEALTGKFTADLSADPKFPAVNVNGELVELAEPDKYTLAPVKDETNNYVEVNLATPKTLAAGENLPLYVVVNSGTYAPGATVEVMANPTGDALVSHVYSKVIDAQNTFSRPIRRNINLNIGGFNCEIEVTEAGKDKVVFINNEEDLMALPKAVNAGETTYEGITFILTENLNLEGIKWEPIGNVKSYPSCTFAGTFDGNGKTIKNLTASASGDEGLASAGLFGSITGVVKNLTLENVDIKSTHYAGAIAGYSSTNVGMKIENCHVVGGRIVSVPEIVGKDYDNGDKAGAIIGFMVAGDEVVGCTARTVMIQAYRELGGIAGHAQGTVKKCKVEDVDLIIHADPVHNYKHYKTSAEHLAKAIVGNDEKATLEGNEASDVTIDAVGFPIQADNGFYRTFAGALNAGAKEVALLEAGEYELKADQDILTETLKVTGVSTAARITFANTNEGGGVDDMSGVNATFENVTIVGSNVNDFGMKQAGNMTYNGCVIENQIFCYNEGEAKSTFTKCTFIQKSKDWYNICTDGSNVDFNNCLFESAGMAAWVYDAKNGGWKTVKFNHCNFFAPTHVDGKAAIEIDSSVKSYNVEIGNNCTARGFDAGSMSGNTLYNLKNGFYGVNCHIYLDGTHLETAYKDAKYYFAPEQDWLSVDTPVRYVAYCIDENNANNNVYVRMTEENGVYSCEIPGVCEKVQFFITSATNETDDITSAMKKTAELQISRNAGVAKYNATSKIWE